MKDGGLGDSSRGGVCACSLMSFNIVFSLECTARSEMIVQILVVMTAMIRFCVVIAMDLI